MPLSVPCFIAFSIAFSITGMPPSAQLFCILRHHGAHSRCTLATKQFWRRNHWTPSHVWPHPPDWQKLSCSTWQNNTNTHHMNRIQSHKVLYNFSICQEFPTKVPEYIILHEVLHWLSKPLATSAHLGACVIVVNFRLDLDNILIFSTWERGFKATDQWQPASCA